MIADESAGSAVQLENIDWQVAGFGSVPIAGNLGDYDIFFRLISDGRRMRAFDGCNAIWANYRITDKQLQFVNVGRTEWKCSRAQEQRDAFIKLLASSAKWGVVGERLELYDTTDQLVVGFERSGELTLRNADKRD
jgi:heat shock protein HslJ